MTKKFNGFTLAEVLITLGIIGVVAAMTMPTLINQTNGAQYKAAYKKALSAISQGITLNVALEDKGFAEATVASTKAAPPDSVAGFLKGRMNIVNIDNKESYTNANVTFPTITSKYCTETKTTGTGNEAVTTTKVVTCEDGAANQTTTFAPDVFMYFNDSSMFAIKGEQSTNCKEATPCLGVIDVNGVKGPNKLIETSSNPTDIYPVVYFDQSIRPASDAASQVLYAK